MQNWEQVCPHCFKSTYENGKCAFCGYQVNDYKQDDNALPIFTILDGKYMLGHCIGAGGFGITYVALDLGTQKRCAIKEYFPANIAYRNVNTECVSCEKGDEREYSHGKSRFCDEAKVLASLSGTEHIVRILSYLMANNTAYIVMDYIDGINLNKWMHIRQRTFSYEETKKVFLSVADALKVVHGKRHLHRDLTPENILIDHNDNVVIVDFGSAKDYIRNATGMSVMVKRGYAPVEQYSSEKRQGPYTDIYSLCCTLYYISSGKHVPDVFDRINGASVERLDQLVPDIPKQFACMVEKGMSIQSEDRYQSIDEMLSDFSSAQIFSLRPIVMGQAQWNEEKVENSPEKSGDHDFFQNFWEKLKVFLGFVEEKPISLREDTYNPLKSEEIKFVRPIVFSINEGPAKGFILKIQKDGSYTIGRSEKQCIAPIKGDHPQISRLHCIITSQNHGKRLLLEDRSANGTYTEKYGRLEPNRIYDVSQESVFYLATRQYAIRVVK